MNEEGLLLPEGGGGFFCVVPGALPLFGKLNCRANDNPAGAWYYCYRLMMLCFLTNLYKGRMLRMRFFHLGDLHFGKTLQRVPLVEEDQRAWVEGFLRKVEEYRPDAVVVAGDVYDTSQPSHEAIRLFNRFMVGLDRLGVEVFIIPGNHDSAVRLASGGEYMKSNIHFAGELTAELPHFRVERDGVPVTFWLLPHFYKRTVAALLQREENYGSYNEAVKELLARQPINTAECNVLVAHQNVCAGSIVPERSGSESGEPRVVGGLDGIDVSCFDQFDYVALGHIHDAQAIGRDTVRYSGCPLYYDFSEGEERTAGQRTRAERDKRLTLVEITGKGQVKMERIELPPLHRLVCLRDTVEELEKYGHALSIEEKKCTWYKLVCTDRRLPQGTGETLRRAFSWEETGQTHKAVLHIEQEISPVAAGAAKRVDGSFKALPLCEQFAQFYNSRNGEPLPELQRQIIEKIIGQQEKSDFFVDDTKNREKIAMDTQKLLAEIERLLKEEAE